MLKPLKAQQPNSSAEARIRNLKESVKRLHEQGLSHREVCYKLKIARDVCDRYLREVDVTKIDRELCHCGQKLSEHRLCNGCGIKIGPGHPDEDFASAETGLCMTCLRFGQKREQKRKEIDSIPLRVRFGITSERWQAALARFADGSASC